MTTPKACAAHPLGEAAGSASRSSKPAYPRECPKCGAFLHQSHAAIYGECVLCGARVKPNAKG